MGLRVGTVVGDAVGDVVGVCEGSADGVTVGDIVGDVGEYVGAADAIHREFVSGVLTNPARQMQTKSPSGSDPQVVVKMSHP